MKTELNERILGTFERLIWEASKHNSFNFCVAAQVTGHIPYEVLRKSLDIVQLAYPILTMQIKEFSKICHFSYSVSLRQPYLTSF